MGLRKRSINVILIVFGLLLSFYYYRICNRVLAHYVGEKDHIDALIYLTFIAIVVFGMIRNSSLLKMPLARIMLLFVIYLFFNGGVNFILGSISIQDYFKSFMWVMPFFCLLFFYKDDSRDEKIVFITMFIVSLICIAAGVMGMSWFALETVLTDDNDEINEIVNIVAFSVITLPFVILYKNVVIRLGLLAAISVVVLFSMRRIAVICLVLTIVIVILDLVKGQQVEIGKRRKRFKQLISIALFVVICYFGYQLVTGELSAIWDNVIQRFSEIEEKGGSGRTDLWADVIRKLDDNSFIAWIFGNGFLGVNRLAGHTAAHNEFLEMLYDFGLVGLLLYTSMHAVMIKRIITLFRQKSELKLPYFVCYICFFFYSMLGNVIIYPQYAFSLFVFWGYAEKKLILEKKMKKQKLLALVQDT